MTTMSTSRVRRGEVELAVFESGNPDGETLVMLHGWPDTHHLWDGVVPLLADRYRIVCYDQRGHGESTDPARVEDFRLAELAADLFAVIDAVSPGTPVHVVAHDWGSVQAWEAVCEPGAERRIASFTSISGPNLDHLGTVLRESLRKPTPRNLVAPLGQAASSLYTLFFMMPVLPRAFFRLFGSRRNCERFLRALEGTPAERVHLGDTLGHDLVSGLRIYRANIFGHVLRPRERRTDIPVHLLVNTRDIAVRPAGYRDTGRWVRRLERTDIPAGHWLPYSRPETIADEVSRFVTRSADNDNAGARR